MLGVTCRLDEFGDPGRVAGPFLVDGSVASRWLAECREGEGAQRAVHAAGQVAALLATDDHQRAARGERPTQPRQVRVARDVEDQVERRVPSAKSSRV